MAVHPDPISVTFVYQHHKSKFEVTEERENVLFRLKVKGCNGENQMRQGGERIGYCK